MRGSSVFLWSVLAAALAASPSARAEDEPPRISCGPQAALYQGDKGLKVWATRRGATSRDNPLRPLSRDRLVVLEVVVNGRLATAYGPDFDNLRQGGAARDLERDGGDPVRWEEAGAMPDAIRVVAEDGSVLLGPMRFAECAEAPQSKAVAPRKADPKPDRKPGGAASRDGPSVPTRPLPQGALPGLSLPKPGSE